MRSFRAEALPVWLGLAALSAVALLAVPEPAEACGKGVCPRGYFAPREGKTVPANAPALFYTETKAAPNGAANVVLTTDAGATTVPLATEPSGASGQSLLRPLAALEAGKTYQISHYQSCGTGAPVGFATHTFLAGPAAPLPSTAGEITGATSWVAEDYEVYAGSKCRDPLRAAVTRLTFVPSAELTPYLSVAYFSFSVDGEPYAASQVGHGPNDVVPHPYWERWLLEAHGACQEPTKESQLIRGLTLGEHTYELTTFIAGATTQPPALTGTFTLACDGVPSTPPPATGSGGSSSNAANAGSAGSAAAPPGSAGQATAPPNAGTAGSGAGGAASPSGLEPAAVTDADGAGCAVAAVSSSSWASGLGIIAALGAILARGRRRSR